MKRLLLWLICLVVISTMSIQCLPRQSYYAFVRIQNYEIGKEKMANVGSLMVTNKGCSHTKDQTTGCTPARDDLRCWQRGDLIYAGISKNTIRLTYREFLYEMARPSFHQDLTYDLDASGIIQFRGLKLRILDASNAFVKFIVLEQTEDILPKPIKSIPKGEYDYRYEYKIE